MRLLVWITGETTFSLMKFAVPRTVAMVSFVSAIIGFSSLCTILVNRQICQIKMPSSTQTAMLVSARKMIKMSRTVPTITVNSLLCQAVRVWTIGSSSMTSLRAMTPPPRQWSPL